MKTLGKKVNALAKSVDKLAIAVKKGFDETATKVQVGILEERLDGVKVRLDTVEKTTTRIENGLNNRLDRAEDNIVLLKAHAGIR